MAWKHFWLSGVLTSRHAVPTSGYGKDQARDTRQARRDSHKERTQHWLVAPFGPALVTPTSNLCPWEDNSNDCFTASQIEYYNSQLRTAGIGQTGYLASSFQLFSKLEEKADDFGGCADVEEPATDVYIHHSSLCPDSTNSVPSLHIKFTFKPF